MLRQVESKGKKYYHDGVLPCTGDLKCAAKVIENRATEIVPFTEYQSVWGKGIRFCEARAVHTVIDALSLTDKAKGCISISESIDSAQITKNMHLITAGFKLGDGDVIDPLSKKPLCINGVYTNLQSRNNFFSTQIMFSKETKESYEAFKVFFDFFAMAGNSTESKEDLLHYWAALDGFHDFDLTATMDMSVQWKGLHKGGACKKSRFFCHCCTVESKDVHHLNGMKCQHFCAGNPNPLGRGTVTPLLSLPIVVQSS